MSSAVVGANWFLPKFLSDGRLVVDRAGKQKIYDEKKSRYYFNYYSNKIHKEEKADRYYIPGVAGVVGYYVKGRNFYKSHLPLGVYSPDELEAKEKGKRIRLHPACHIQSVINYGSKFWETFQILNVHDTVLIWLDFDDQHKDYVEAQLKNNKDHVLADLDYLITPSMSGEGAHGFVLADLSNIRYEKVYAQNQEEGASKYKETERYRYLTALTTKICDDIEKNVPTLKVDKVCVTGHVAFLREEVKQVNAFFKDKHPKPIIFKDDFSAEILEKEDKEYLALQSQLKLEEATAKRTKKNTERLIEMTSNWFEEFNRCLDSDVMVLAKEIQDYSVRYLGADPTCLQLYVKALILLKSKQNEIKTSIIENWSKNKIYTLKKESLAIGVDGVLSLFGLSSRKDLSPYIRRIFCYTLNVRKTSNYIFKKYTDKFSFIPENIDGKSFFSADFLVENWWMKTCAHIPSEEEIAEQFGNGNTLIALRKLTPFLVGTIGMDDALALLEAGVDISNANDKDKRKRDIEKLAKKVVLRKNQPIPI